jgi:hypothetical protein
MGIEGSSIPKRFQGMTKIGVGIRSTGVLTGLLGVGVAISSAIAYGGMPAGVESMVVMKGRCTTFSIGNAKYQCSSAVYSHFANGRTAFNIPTKTGVLMLSGGKDSQLDATRYKLIVDRVRFSDGKIQNQYDAKGDCQMRLSADGAYMHELACHASNGVEQINIVFVGDGSPVEQLGG